MDTELRQTLTRSVESAMADAERNVMRWGRDDCALWCANAIRDALEYDPAASFRGRYRSRNGALRVLGRRGLRGAIGAAARKHGWSKVRPDMAQPGDVGLAYIAPDVLATVICRAPGWFVGRNEGGFTALPARYVAMAWSVLNDARAEYGGPYMPMMYRHGIGLVPAPAEPISTFIGFTALIAGGLGVSTAVAGAVGGFIISAAIGVGISAVSSLIQPHPATGSVGPEAELSATTAESVGSVQVTERQSIPSKRVIVGSQYVGGALFFEKVSAPYLMLGTLLNFGQISSIDAVYIGINKLTFSAITPNTILTPLGIVGQPNYPGRLRASFRYGAAGQTLDPLIAARFPSTDSNFKQQGIATAVFEYHFGTDQTEFTALWGQVARPNSFLVVRGIAVYDPRDQTQSLTDETTWKWSDNASLVQATYLTRDYGGRIAKTKIDWTKVADSANYDDELVGCSDGTYIKRHTINGVITLNQKPFEVLTQMLTANRAFVLESGGKVWVSSARPKSPVATIHDGIIAGPIKYQSARAKREMFNKILVRFVATEQDYQIVDGPILSRADLQATDGEVLPGTLALNFTQDYRRAERLQKQFLASSRKGRTITVPVSLDLLAVAGDELIGSAVTFASVIFPSMNGTYLVTSVGFADDFSTLSLALTEYDASIETDWTPSTDEKPFTLATV